MDKTLKSLAILMVNSDILKTDYLDSYVPFIATLIRQKKYLEIDPNTICEDFSKEFGLIIPLHPMLTLLNRSKKKGLLKQIEHKLIAVPEKINACDFSKQSKQQLDNYDVIISSFINYSAARYKTYYSIPEAETIFISYLKEHDLDILFAAHNQSLLPSAKVTKKKKFIINKFISHVYTENKDLFRLISDLASGYLIASPILYDNFESYKGKFEGLDIYLDTRFVLRFLGAEGKARQDSYEELIKILGSQGAQLFIFNHTYDEFMGILQDCLSWIDDPKYDHRRASPALRYFKQSDFSRSDLERFIVNVDRKLEKNKISLKNAPDPNEYQKYQIDEEKLKLIIIDTYKETGPFVEDISKDLVIQRDIKSIAAISKYRKDRKPTFLTHAGSIFITTNSSLAFANRKFEIAENHTDVIIPACLTEVFIGTLTWLQAPNKYANLNEKKMLADCFAAIQPSDSLIKKYLDELEKLDKEGKISSEEYYLLRTHRISYELLQDKVMGDPESISDKTPSEILNEMTDRIKKDGVKKLLKEKEIHESTKGELKKEKVEKEMIVRNLHKRALQVSSLISWIIISIIFVVALIGIVIQSFPELNIVHGKLKVILLIASIVLLFISSATGLNLIGLRNKLIQRISKKIVKYLKGYY